MGAIRLRGTENITIINNYFSTLDGNAVFLDGYNRFAIITSNEFYFLGGSAIALWGYEERGDGTSGNQPRFNEISGNMIHHLGLYTKQSCAIFSAVSENSQTSISHRDVKIISKPVDVAESRKHLPN